jgi:hypothetical protein
MTMKNLTLEQKLEALTYAQLNILSELEEMETYPDMALGIGICVHVAAWINLEIYPKHDNNKWTYPGDALTYVHELLKIKPECVKPFHLWWSTYKQGHLERSAALDTLIDHLEKLIYATSADDKR